MSEPVSEHIGAFIESALKEITTANGFNYSLTATRAKRFLLADQPLSDLTAYILQGQTNFEPSANSSDSRIIRQQYMIWVVALQSDDASESIDTKLNRICADIAKKLCHDRTCGGYATFLELVSAEPTDMPETGMLLTVEIMYATRWDDSYVPT